jgi:outer membrane beta-barrel protein
MMSFKLSKKTLRPLVLTLSLLAMIGASVARADDSTTTSAGKLPVDKMKDKYWQRGSDTSEVRVVQNRLYSKARTFELGLYVGSISTDPFLSVKNYGLSLGYHINDYFGLVALGWKESVSPSDALTLLQGPPTNTTANTNDPKSFVGGELDFVPLYGKLSLVGKAIIYFDTHIDLGAGGTATETGNDFTQFIGLGEQIYLNSWSSLTLDYRLTRYVETLDQKTLGQPGLGASIGNRTDLNDVVTIGISFFGHII